MPSLSGDIIGNIPLVAGICNHGAPSTSAFDNKLI